MEPQRASESLRETQRDSERIREPQRVSESLRETQRDSERLRETQRASERLRENQRASESLREPQRDSESLRENQRASERLRESQRDSERLRENQRDSETQRDSESLREPQRESERLRETQRVSERIRETQRDSERLREPLRLREIREAPSVLMCGDEDWDVIGQAAANRECGAGLTYNEQQRSFLFDFGGQQFDITDSALPADSKNKTDYKASIVRFQAVYLNTAAAASSSCATAEQTPPLDASVQQRFVSVSEEEVLVDPQRKPPSLSFWLNKRNYDSQQALLWVLPLLLLSDSRVCGAYDNPLRAACRPLLDRAPNNTYSKKGSGSVSGVVMRILVAVASASCGTPNLQTCSEDDSTSWRTQDCRASDIRTRPEPLGCTRNLWRLLSGSSLLVDSSLSTYDIIHMSRDIAAGNRDATRDWCLHACQEAESCVGVALSEEGGATRCVLYPDTSTCGLSSAPNAPSPASSCRLVIREPASQVYLKTERLPLVTSVSIPGHGILRGVAVETSLGSDRRTVVQFLGVPYARPPIGSLRFEAAQAADWTGTWTTHRAPPGDEESSSSSEDCLYLNIYSLLRANQKPGLLDGSALAALGNIVVVSPVSVVNYGLSDQEAGLPGFTPHLGGWGGQQSGDGGGGEEGGRHHSLLLLSSSSTPLFQRMMLMPTSSSRAQALALALELGCVTSDLSGVTSDLSDNDRLSSCLRAAPAHKLNAAQTKVGVDLLLGTSAEDGLISRARRIKDFESLRGRTDGRSLFYEALSRSLGGPTGSELLKEAASWFYSLDHDEASGRTSPFLWTCSWCLGRLISQSARSVSRPQSGALCGRHELPLPQWKQVSEAPPTYLQLSPALLNQRGLSQSACSFWGGLGARLLGRDFKEVKRIHQLATIETFKKYDYLSPSSSCFHFFIVFPLLHRVSTSSSCFHFFIVFPVHRG
ncbi:hypothetical protein F7725_017797 [Dissostichus mawsoni]|uniref:Carboxylesterase type B domain-containing protein n=1 Tax=Dissostichus mawsoni TaxID=36200 RepID=A0A7J5XPY2_DISMA|nr:hypothetical protein F7725_017797 [Dissostichus mawsoni]